MMNHNVWLFLLLLGIGLLAACGGGSSESGQTTSNGSSPSGSPPAPPPDPPAPQFRTVTLSWDPSVPFIWDQETGFSATAIQYKVYYGTASGVCGNGQPTDVGSKTTYTIAGLQPQTQYYFAVKALNSFGESSCSEVSMTTP